MIFIFGIVLLTGLDNIRKRRCLHDYDLLE